MSAHPANIPASTVTGSASVVDDTSVYLARVAVPTDVGTYEVLLVRQAAGEVGVERLFPPDGVGP